MSFRDYQNQANAGTRGRVGDVIDQVGDAIGGALGQMPAPEVHVRQADVTIDPKLIAMALLGAVLLLKLVR